MTAGRILVVCTGNICRSPVGAAMLLHGITREGVLVTSAGTHALVDHPPAPEAIEFICREVRTAIADRGVQLTKQNAESADLVITMTEEQRSWVARNAPRVVNRTFTMLELSRIVKYLDTPEGFDTLAAFSAKCAPLRSRARSTTAVIDIEDPYGGPKERYENSFRAVAQASHPIVAAINGGTG